MEAIRKECREKKGKIVTISNSALESSKNALVCRKRALVKKIEITKYYNITVRKSPNPKRASVNSKLCFTLKEWKHIRTHVHTKGG